MRRASEWLAVGLAAVVAIRAVRFVGNPGAASARGEREYFAWAWRSPVLLDRLEKARPLLLDGELISIAVPPGSLEPRWTRIVVDNALPSQNLVAVDASGERRILPHVTRLVLESSGRLTILRPTRVGRP